MTLRNRLHSGTPDRLPERVDLTVPMVQDALLDGPVGRPLLGIGIDGGPVYLGADGPHTHTMVTAGARRGASSILRTIAAQFMRGGAHMTFIDLSRSQGWALNLPGVEYVTGQREADEALVALAQMAEATNIDTDAGYGAPSERRGVVIDGLAVMSGWRRRRGGVDAYDALADLLLNGRSAGFHVLASGTWSAGAAAASLSLDLRTAFTSFLVDAGISRARWDRLATARPAPPRTRQRGRFHLVDDATARTFTGLHLTEPEAQAIATTRSEAR